ncbi:TetR/AcrR family transcriptional regulator [Clostridium estertheticum]|nr:TetR/AcrR family transcriptional regulator [Clostridium estertheticum]MBX4262605.1 TetR/AcrR family transcriptional regulator [Clostridium estertheticum]MCB2340271.1 TetR/AcrR family transcriptional regulator [Clostridium estertheticum]WLC71610.1 TetR/AcrR family transcriptional regulator [Clostridium estertheticum]
MLEKNNGNQRVMLTKRLIREALLKMLKTRNINKISIRELCQVAGINRTTFYNHYGSQYDVLNEIAETYIQNTSFTVINDIAAGKNIDECLTRVLQYMKDNLEFAKLVLDLDNYDLITHITISLPQFDHMVIKHLPENLDLEEKKAIASYVQYGAVRLIKEWILSDCLKSPEKEAKLILYIAGRVIGN